MASNKILIVSHGCTDFHQSDFLTLRREGLEPPPLAGQDPKSCASANFATAAQLKNQISN